MLQDHWEMSSKHGLYEGTSEERPLKRKKSNLEDTVSSKVKSHKVKHLIKSLKVKSEEVVMLKKDLEAAQTAADNSSTISALISGIWHELHTTLSSMVPSTDSRPADGIEPSSLKELLTLQSFANEEDSYDLNQMLRRRAESTGALLKQLCVTLLEHKTPLFDVDRLLDHSKASSRINLLLTRLVHYKERIDALEVSKEQLGSETKRLVSTCERLRTEMAEGVAQSKTKVPEITEVKHSDASEAIEQYEKNAKDLQMEIDFLKHQAIKDAETIQQLTGEKAGYENELRRRDMAIGEMQSVLKQRQVSDGVKAFVSSEVHQDLMKRLNGMERLLDFKDKLIADIRTRFDAEQNGLKEISHDLETKWREASEELLHLQTLCEQLRVHAEKHERRSEELEAFVQSIHLEDPKESAELFVNELLGLSNSIESMNSKSFGENGTCACTTLRKEREEWKEMESDLKFLLEGYKKKATVEAHELQELRLKVKKLESIPRPSAPASDAEKKILVQERKNSYLSSQLKSITIKFKTLQAENLKLVTKLQQQGDANALLRFEMQKLTRLDTLIERFSKLLSEQGKIQAVEDASREQIRQLKTSNEKMEAFSRANFLKTSEIETQVQSVIETFNGKVSQLTKTSLQIEELSRFKEVSEKRASAVIKELERLKVTHEKLRNENQSLLGRLARLRSGRQDVAAETELEMYRRMVTCSVCDKRRKNVTITRCRHMFCSECIQTNLETRHRKCPACGKPFGAEDLVNVHLA